VEKCTIKSTCYFWLHVVATWFIGKKFYNHLEYCHYADQLEWSWISVRIAYWWTLIGRLFFQILVEGVYCQSMCVSLCVWACACTHATVHPCVSLCVWVYACMHATVFLYTCTCMCVIFFSRAGVWSWWILCVE